MNTNQRNRWLAAAGLGALLLARTAWRRANAFSFANRTVLITGGSRGLGLVLARQLADEGARLAICARDEAELARAAAEVRGIGAEVLPVVCDVTVQAEVEAMIAQVQAQMGPVDVLINNAGIISAGPVEEMLLDDYERAMKTHFYAPLYTLLALTPQMQRRGEGRIVNISSVGGRVALPHMAPYSASKFALVGLSQALRAELKKDKVVVTTVCPGLLRTGSHLHAEMKGQHKKEFAAFSILGALPLISMGAEHAARAIINACRYGDAEITLTLPAKLMGALHGVAPGLMANLLGYLNFLLPGPGGIGTATAVGAENFSELSPSAITSSIDSAAERNNEV